MRRPSDGFKAVLAIAVAVVTEVYAVAVFCRAATPTDPPIVLQSRETPVFLGPHEQWVSALAFSPDGKTLATGAADGYLRFWDTNSGALKSIRGDDATRGIAGVAFAPDGLRVAAVGGLLDKEVVLYDTTAELIARTFDVQSDAYAAVTPAPATAPFLYKGKPVDFRVFTAVAYSPHGKVLATAPGGVVLRDAKSGLVIATLDQPSKGVKALVFSPDGKTLAAASDDRKVRLWNVPDGTLQATCTGPTQPLVSVAFSPAGDRIVAASSGQRSILDKSPVGYLWSWKRPGDPPRKIELGDGPVGQLAFVSPGKVVVGVGRRLLEVDLQSDNSAPTRKLSSASEEILAVAVSPDRIRVAFGGKDRTVDVVDAASGKLVHRLPGSTSRFSAVARSDDGKWFATASIDYRFSNHLPTKDLPFADRYRTYFSDDANAGRMQPSEIRVWSAEDGQLHSMLSLPPSQVTAIDFVTGTRQLVVAGWRPDLGGMLSVYDADSGKHLRDLPSRDAEILAIDVSPDGDSLARGDAEGNFELADSQSGNSIRTHKLDHAIEAVTYSKDGKLLAVAGADRTVGLFESTNGSLTKSLASQARIESLDFSPDGKWLAAGTRAEGLELWDLRASASSRTLKAPGDYFETMPGFVAFSSDGRFVACGGHGKDIAVFEVATATLFCELRGHEHPATAAVFLPDGRLVSGGEEGAIRIWDPVQRALLATWMAVPADSSRNWSDQWVGFTPTGKFVGSKNLDRLVGWESKGETLIGAEVPNRQVRVENLFDCGPSATGAP